ncbi:MAG: nicotinate-nucleotide--dimethylbenzimidazole phosphoribosyltransferase [Spirochaetia bacterium]|nr:nicotinate-nucleotide--dimethylbenzimidazole phosphoribosyltransferase [Spirochaetia bacterium]
MKEIIELAKNINPTDKNLKEEIQKHQDDLTKPQGSLGRLENFAEKFCLIQNTTKPALQKKAIYTFAGDHGIAEEGVSAFPQAVTYQMVLNMITEGAAVNVLSKHGGIENVIVDIGVINEFADHPLLEKKKVKEGTANMLKGPAMTEEECLQAIKAGIDCAEAAAEKGVDILGTGEMGIANTTPSSAIYACLLPCPVYDVTGAGTGLSEDKIKIKAEIIEKALEINNAKDKNPLEVLTSVGGFEIAGILGLILGAAIRKIPVVVDGFISSAAALTAVRLNEDIKDYLFFSHLSKEKGHIRLLEELNEKPILNLDMRLGEGTGAALAISIIEASIKIYNEMATFSSAGVTEKS